jgi:hypothetical protein
MEFWTESVQNKTVSEQSDFLNLITPKTLACLWVSEEPLYKRESPFQWFNYLLDGNLEAHLKHLPANEKSFFTVNHYGETFYLLQVEKSFPDINKAVKEAFQIIKPQNEKKEVLCLGHNPQHFSLPYLKQNKEVSFETVLY